MTEAQRALDEIERVLKLLTADLEDDAWSEFGKNKQIRYATNLKLGDLRRGHRALSLLPTLRAALAPPTTPSPPAWLLDLDEASAVREIAARMGVPVDTGADDEISAIRARQAERAKSCPPDSDYTLLSVSDAVSAFHDCEKLLAEVDYLAPNEALLRKELHRVSADVKRALDLVHATQAELAKERERRVEVEMRCKDLSYVHEGGVMRMLAFLREARFYVDPIVMSSAVGLYLETVDRAATFTKDTP